jgi:hypothetical protein
MYSPLAIGSECPNRGLSKCSLAPGVRFFAFEGDHFRLIDRNVRDGETRCRSSVTDHETRRLILIVVCARIQWSLPPNKLGKFRAVGDGCQEGSHGSGLIDASRRNEHRERFTHGANWRRSAEFVCGQGATWMALPTLEEAHSSAGDAASTTATHAPPY